MCPIVGSVRRHKRYHKEVVADDDSDADDGRHSTTTPVVRAIMFIRSQKKNAQLVYNGFIYNKKLVQANGHTTWRCSNVSRDRCRAVVTTLHNRLKAVRRDHEHEPHWDRIADRMLYEEEEALEQQQQKQQQQRANVKEEEDSDDARVMVASFDSNPLITDGERNCEINDRMKLKPRIRTAI